MCNSLIIYSVSVSWVLKCKYSFSTRSVKKKMVSEQCIPDTCKKKMRPVSLIVAISNVYRWENLTREILDSGTTSHSLPHKHPPAVCFFSV